MAEIVGLVDSHAHLDMDEFNQDRDLVVKRASQNGVRIILCPLEITNPKSIQTSLELASKYESLVFAAGNHPHHAKYFNANHSQKIRELLSQKKIMAIGEIGLDFYYNFSALHEQREAFRSQLNLAEELDLPVVIHSRNSGHEVALAIEEELFTRGGVLHCFTEDWDIAKKVLNQNFYISFSGILTFPNAQSLRETARKIPLEKLLIETDSPYLVPVPQRGTIKRNEPAYVVEIAKILAEIKKISLAELAATVSRNFNSLFMFEKKIPQC